MNIDIIEGANDKTDAGLRAILLAQARLRALVAIPVVVGASLLFFSMPNQNLGWPLTHLTCYCIYIALAYVFANNNNISPRTLLILTAILDPLALSVWLIITGEYGSLIVGFYLFTTLGFGFRTGRPLMHLCQIASIVGFSMVLMYTGFWRQHVVIWFALLVPLIAVPAYAGELIKTLRDARDYARRESQAKSDLLAKVSHELRTPLTGIISATELLVTESDNPQVSKRTSTILALSKELLFEINDLLDEAKYDAHVLTLNTASLDLNNQIAMVRATLETVASKKGLELHTDIDPAITGLVMGDSHHLNRVLVNLVGNAVKFTEQGSVQLAIELLEQTAANYRLRFSITDTGIGIPEDFHGKLFEPFSQVDQGASRRYGGTGLGLTLSKKIVDLLGGELCFESTLGKGSRFWFDITLQRDVVISNEGATPSQPASIDVVVAKRILVAEDNETNVLLLKELLEIDQHQVTTCTSGMEALEVLAKQEFDVLLLDYNLGDMDGVRVLQTYQFGCLNPAPALFLTADVTSLTANRLKAVGGAGTLYKPVRLADLRHALAQIHMPMADAPVTSEEEVLLSSAAMEEAKPSAPALKVVRISPLDQEVLDELKTVSRRPEFFPELLTEAGNDITRCCQEILEALVSRDDVLLRDAAHALKGVSANVGAVRLSILASTLMQASREKLDNSRERWRNDIHDASRITLSALKAEVDEAWSALSSTTATL